MLHLKAMKWYHSAKMYLQQITERIQESFGGSEMIFPAHFTVKHPYLFLHILFLHLNSEVYSNVLTNETDMFAA